MNQFVVSDTHFGHHNIIGYCGRPFSCVEEMDETLVDNWNAVVKPGAHIYPLGDVAIKKTSLALVKRLNGRKRLVMGNYDIFDVQEYLDADFQKLHGSRVFDGLLLTHIPVSIESRGRFLANVHGHIHERMLADQFYVNVSVEVTN